LLAVALSIALMVTDHHQPHFKAMRSHLSAVVYPIHYIANLPLDLYHWVSESISTHNQLVSQNRELREVNLLLRGRQQKMDALEKENIRLRGLLESSIRIGDRVLIGELVAVDLDPYKQLVLINKGEHSEVFSGQAVVDANGVLGQVVQVSPFSSGVLLITDASHSLPVQVNRNGLRTIARGTGNINQLEIPYLPTNADIAEGDLLITSGLGGHFPAGYPVARVSSITHQPGRPFATIEAVPTAHLDRIREVLLVWNISPDQSGLFQEEPAINSGEGNSP
jgi:rod shape-determining protein MreC